MARNNIGLSDSSAIDKDQETYLSEIPVVSQPTLISDTINSVTLTWDAVIGSLSDIYVVSWAQGASGEFNNSYETTDTFFSATDLVKRQTYRFRVQVKTPCDYGL
jgi:hypothetical protein